MANFTPLKKQNAARATGKHQPQAGFGHDFAGHKNYFFNLISGSSPTNRRRSKRAP
jgi:hypothetical protein